MHRPLKDRARRRCSGRTLASAVLLLTYAVLMFPLGCGEMLADRFMLFPSRDPIRAEGARERLIGTPLGNIHVVIARAPLAEQTITPLGAGGSEGPQRFVLRLEGNGGRAEYTASYIAGRWQDMPTEVWAMNHPGFGRSDGPARLDRLAPAALAVYDAMCREAGDRPVYIDADSMGCTQALYIAAKRQETRPVAGLVLKNPPPLRQLVLGRFGWWNLWLAAGPIAAGVPRELDAITWARRCTTPAIFIRSLSDTLVPPSYQQRVIDAYAGPTFLVDFHNAGHNDPLDEPVEIQIGLALRKLAMNLDPGTELRSEALEPGGRIP